MTKKKKKKNENESKIWRMRIRHRNSKTRRTPGAKLKVTLTLFVEVVSIKISRRRRKSIAVTISSITNEERRREERLAFESNVFHPWANCGNCKWPILNSHKHYMHSFSFSAWQLISHKRTQTQQTFFLFSFSNNEMNAWHISHCVI